MSNFNFIMPISEKLYEYCVNAEKLAKTHPKECLRLSRISLEYFLKEVCYTHRLIEPNKDTELYMMIEKVVSASIINQRSHMDDIRKSGNKLSHAGNHFILTQDAITTTKNLHIIISGYFNQYKNLKVSNFNEDLIPIGNFVPETALKPEHYETCIKKYLGTYKNEYTGTVTKCIVRQFRKGNGVAEEIRLRDMRVLEKRWTNDPMPQNIIQYINVPTEDICDLLFTSYVITNDTQTLDKINIQNISIPDRLTLIGGIANGIDELHNFDEPIIHRLLTPQCIYIKKDQKGRFVPKIGNFEYAKLSNPSYGTVVNSHLRVKNPFKAPECTLANIQVQPSADIYSLGIIILCIFGISINAYINASPLKSSGLSQEFTGLVEKMISPAPDQRPDIQTVKSIILREVDRYV